MNEVSPEGSPESDSATCAAPPRPATTPGTRAGWALGREPLLLLGLMICFSAFYFVLSYIRFSVLYGSNWDLGGILQALWTNTHGALLYETGLSRSSGAGSFLLVHTAYIAIPVSWLYAAAPYAETLFALQAVVVASAAVPLYLLGRRAHLPRSILYAALAIFLASFPILGALLYDFHWEAFVAVEYLWTYYLLSSNRYWLAYIPALLGILTLEVFPFLVAGIGLYFAYPQIREFLRARRLSASSRRSFLAMVGFVAVALVLFLGLTYLRQNTIPQITGTHLALSAPYPYTTVALGITWWAGISLTELGSRLLYWFLLVSAFGFVPLLYRQRLLILSIPWFAYTVLMTPNPAFTQLGFQYAFLAVPPLAIGFIEGLHDFGAQLGGRSAARLPLFVWPVLLLALLVSSVEYSRALIVGKSVGLWVGFVTGIVVVAAFLVLRWVRQSSKSPFVHGSRLVRPRLSSARTLRVTAVVALLILVGVNFAMSPLNSANLPPRLGNGYSFHYQASPSFPYMAGVVADIPADETVLASTNLFPFVANSFHAHSLLWYPAVAPYLPFNATHLPTYVLLSTSEWFAVPSFLIPALFNESVYGIRDLLYSSASYPGSIYLFELGYTGSTNLVQVNPFPARSVLCGNELVLGPSGAVTAAPGSRCGTIIESVPATRAPANESNIWYGPYSTLLAGNYTVTVSLRGSLSGPGPANAPLLMMNTNAAGAGYWYYALITAVLLSPTQWTNFTFHFQLTEPHPEAELRGYLTGYQNNDTFVPGNVQLNFIEIDYTPP